MKANTALSLQLTFTVQCFRPFFITDKVHGLFYQCYHMPMSSVLQAQNDLHTFSKGSCGKVEMRPEALQDLYLIKM